MEVLVVGAGAVGGYFGARLLEKGVDVTFLVREARQKKLNKEGLIIQSVHGNIHIQNPKTILATDSSDHYDIILIGTKAYHFMKAIEDIKPFVGKETVIIPMLNGIKHLDTLKREFDINQIVGGLCFIESTVDLEGRIIQSSPTHEFVFGELSGKDTERIIKIAELFSGTKATIRNSNKVLTDMWHKYMYISVFSGITSLFRSSIGPILESEHGLEIIENLFTEIGAIMRAADAPILNNIEKTQLNLVKKMEYTMKSSLQRDMEKSQQIEGNHLQGYLLQLAKEHQVSAPYLQMVFANLETYEKILSSKKDIIIPN